MTDTWDNSIVNGKLPTLVDNVGVTIGGQPAYVYFISPTQINFIVPNLSLGEQGVTVTNAGVASASVNVDTGHVRSGLFRVAEQPGGGDVPGLQLRGGERNFSGATTTPAKPGETMHSLGHRIRADESAAPAGEETPSTTTYSPRTRPTVTVNNVSATVYGAALAPGSRGFVSGGDSGAEFARSGKWPVIATIGGVSSPTGLVLAVQ